MMKRLSMFFLIVVLFVVVLTPKTGLADFVLPSGLQVLDDESFLGTSVSGVVKLPSNIKRIGNRVFADSNIYALDLSDTNLESIGSNLLGNQEIAYVITNTGINNNVSEDAFNGTHMLFGNQQWQAYAQRAEIPFININDLYPYEGFYYEIKNGIAKLLCPINAEELPETITLPDSVNGCQITTLSDSAFFNSSQVLQILLPDSVGTIYDGAFDGAPNAVVRYKNNIKITQQPASVFAHEDDWVTLTIQANRTDFRWQYYDGEWVDVTYEGYNTKSLRFQLSKALINEASSWRNKESGLWRCIVSDPLGNSLISDQIYVLEKPYFILEPEDQMGSAGDSVVFSARVGGMFASWNWERSDDNGITWNVMSEMQDESGSCSVIVTAQNRSSLYRAAATDYKGNRYFSREAKIVGLNKVFIETQPEDWYGTEGQEAVFSLDAKNAASYQWQYSSDDGKTWEKINVQSANSNKLVFTINRDHYKQLFRCVVLNGTDSATSNVVRVLESAIDRIQSVSFVSISSNSLEILREGIPVNKTVSVSGYSTESGWVWSSHDVLVVEDDGVTVRQADGQTSDVLEIINAEEQTEDITHILLKLRGKREGRALLKGISGDLEENYFVEVYGEHAIIVEQPKDQTGDIGDMVQFSVDAIGAISYSWTENGFVYDENNTNNLYSIEIQSGQYHENKSGSEWRCEITGRDNQKVFTNRVYVYRPSSSYIEEGNIVAVEGDDISLHCHFFTCSDMYLEYSRDGEKWFEETSDSDIIGGERTLTRTFKMTNAYNYYYRSMWRCRGTGIDGNPVYSDVVQILEPNPVEILKQPEDQVVGVGQTAIFEIEAENALSYRWQISYDGGKTWSYVSYSGVDQTNPSLSVKATQSNYDNVLWRCKVTGVSGYQLNSQVVSLKKPSFCFVQQPSDQTVSIGENATFTVQASEAVSYQWQQRSVNGEWNNIASGTKASITLTATADKIAGMEYRCVITGQNGVTLTSNSVRMIEKLRITRQPEDLTLGIGAYASFTIQSEGTKSWHWYVSKDNGNTWEVPNANGVLSPTLSFTIEQQNFTWIWRCDITGDGQQQLFSQIVRIRPLLMITTQPVNVEAEIGANVTFEISAENAYAYQWQVSSDNGVSWQKASGTSNNRIYSFTVSSQSDYEKRWQCIVTGSNGEQVTSVMTRIMEPSIEPVVYTQPVSQYGSVGTTVEFSLSAAGVKQYQWQISYDEGSNWSNVNSSSAKTSQLSVQVTSALWNSAQWRCKLTGSGGAISYSNSVKVFEPVTITTQPTDAEARVGETVTFVIYANGASEYQWQVSSDEGVTWKNCNDFFVDGYSLDVPVEADHFDKYRWRCIITGLLGDQIYSDIVRIRQTVVPVANFYLDVRETTLQPGITLQIKTTIEPNDATDQTVSWISDEPGVATVNNSGLVTAVSNGVTRIRASVGGIEAVCTVTVANDFTMEFSNFVNETWTNDVNYDGIAIKMSGAVLPCTMNISIMKNNGDVYRSSGSIQAMEETWKWNTEPITETGTYYVLANASDAAGRQVSLRSGDVIVKRRPVYRALLIYQRDWKNGIESSWFMNDAYYLKDLLEQNTYEGGAKYTVSISENQNKNNIKKKIQSTFKDVKDGDVSFIWFSGHGISANYSQQIDSIKKYEGALWVPAASNEKKLNQSNLLIPDYFILASELANWINTYIPKGNVVIGFSSCGSGAMVYPYIAAAKSAPDSDILIESIISGN